LKADAKRFRNAEAQAENSILSLNKFMSELGTRVSAEIDAAQTKQSVLIDNVKKMLTQLAATRDRLEAALEEVHEQIEELRRSIP
jgi:prefoldin subunit 5